MSSLWGACFGGKRQRSDGDEPGDGEDKDERVCLTGKVPESMSAVAEMFDMHVLSREPFVDRDDDLESLMPTPKVLQVTHLPGMYPDEVFYALARERVVRLVECYAGTEECCIAIKAWREYKFADLNAMRVELADECNTAPDASCILIVVRGMMDTPPLQEVLDVGRQIYAKERTVSSRGVDIWLLVCGEGEFHARGRNTLDEFRKTHVFVRAPGPPEISALITTFLSAVSAASREHEEYVSFINDNQPLIAKAAYGYGRHHIVEWLSGVFDLWPSSAERWKTDWDVFAEDALHRRADIKRGIYQLMLGPPESEGAGCINRFGAHLSSPGGVKEFNQAEERELKERQGIDTGEKRQRTTATNPLLPSTEDPVAEAFLNPFAQAMTTAVGSPFACGPSVPPPVPSGASE